MNAEDREYVQLAAKVAVDEAVDRFAVIVCEKIDHRVAAHDANVEAHGTTFLQRCELCPATKAIEGRRAEARGVRKFLRDAKVVASGLIVGAVWLVKEIVSALRGT